MDALEQAKAAHAENDAIECLRALARVVRAPDVEASFEVLNPIRREFVALCLEYKKHEWIVEFLQRVAKLGTVTLVDALARCGEDSEAFAAQCHAMADVYGQFAFFSAPRLAMVLRAIAADLATVNADQTVARRAAEDGRRLMDTNWHPSALPNRVIVRSFAPVVPPVATPLAVLMKPIVVTTPNVLIFDATEDGAHAVFGDGEMEVKYSIFKPGLRKIDNRKWQRWRDELCKHFLEKWVSENWAHAQLVVNAKIDRDGTVEFVVEDAMPTRDYVSPDDAAAAVEAAKAAVQKVANHFRNAIDLAEDDATSVSMQLHFSTAHLYAPRFRTNIEMPLMVISPLRRDFRGRFRGGICDGFANEGLQLPQNCNTVRRGTGPQPVLWTLTLGNEDAHDGQVRPLAASFLQEWINVTRPTRVTEEEIVEAVRSIYHRAGLPEAKVFYCETWRDFAGATEPIVMDTKIANNKIRTLMLRDRATFYERAKSVDAENFGAICKATTRPVNERHDVLFDRMMQFAPSTAMQRAQRSSAPRQLFLSMWGPWDTESLGPYVFMGETGIVSYEDTALPTWKTLHNEVFGALFTEDFAYVCARQHVTPQMIDQEQNVERRRLYLELYGVANYLQKSKYEVVDQDEHYGTLLRRTMRSDEPIVMLRVLNSTLEPDGTRKEYFLRVPPDVVTAKEAVAWTFDMDAAQYQPKKET